MSFATEYSLNWDGEKTPYSKKEQSSSNWMQSAERQHTMLCLVEIWAFKKDTRETSALTWLIERPLSHNKTQLR